MLTLLRCKRKSVSTSATGIAEEFLRLTAYRRGGYTHPMSKSKIPASRLASEGDLVTFEVSAQLIRVSGPIRRELRPADIDLESTQLYFGEEELTIGSPEADPIFNAKLTGQKKGAVRAFRVEYPDYEKDNILIVPLPTLQKLGVSRALIEPGRVLNRDMLRGKVKVDGKQTELTILSVDEKEGVEYAVLDTHERTRGLTIEYRIKVVAIGENEKQDNPPRSLT